MTKTTSRVSIVHPAIAPETVIPQEEEEFMKERSKYYRGFIKGSHFYDPLK